MVLYELMSGKRPFENLPDLVIGATILQGKKPVVPEDTRQELKIFLPMYASLAVVRLGEVIAADVAGSNVQNTTLTRGQRCPRLRFAHLINHIAPTLCNYRNN